MRTRLLHRVTRCLAAAAISGAALTVAAPASAVQFDFEFKPALIPSFETADGQVMLALARSAAKRWEPVLTQSDVIHVKLFWEDYTDGTLGFTNAWNNISMDADLSDNVCSFGPCGGAWFFDPTPDDDSEFAMQQVLFGQLSAPLQQAWFTGTPPSLLEVGFGGAAKPNGPASGLLDIVSVMIHELGHAVALDNWGYDYDIHPDLIGDIGGVALIDDDLQGHIAGSDVNGAPVPSAQNVCMTPSTQSGFRWVPGAAVYMAATDELSGAPRLRLPRADFLGNANVAITPDWGIRLNWEGGEVPDASTEAFVRGTSTVKRASGVAKTLTIGTFAAVSTDDNALQINGPPQPWDGPAATTIDGGTMTLGPTAAGSLRTTTLAIQPAGMFDTHGGQGGASDLTSIAAGGTLVVRAVAGNPALAGFDTQSLASAGNIELGDGFMTVAGQLASSGLLRGHGTLEVGGLLNDGTLMTKGGALRIGPSKAIDLDGKDKGVGATGTVEVCDGDLLVDGAFTDDFDGQLAICPGQAFDYHGASLRLGPSGSVLFSGGSQPALMMGAEASLDGMVTVWSADATIEADYIGTSATTDVAVSPGASLELSGGIHYCGGKIHGGGALRQTGEAFVDCDTLLDVQNVDLTGFGTTKTHVADKTLLRVDTGALGNYGAGFGGGLELAAGSTFTVNMSPQGPWAVTTNGVISVGDQAAVTGSSVVSHGAVAGVPGGLGSFFVQSFDNEAFLAPGGVTGVGAFYFSHDLTQGSSGTLDVDIADLKTFDSLTAKAVCTIDGVVEARLLGGYVPKSGDAFDIATCELVVLAATAVATGPALTGEDVWQLRTVGNVLQLFVAPLP